MSVRVWVNLLAADAALLIGGEAVEHEGVDVGVGAVGDA